MQELATLASIVAALSVGVIEPRAELRDGGPRGCRVKQNPGACHSVGHGRRGRHLRRRGAARAAECPAGGAGALCGPQGPRRSVPLLPGLSHIQIRAAASRARRRQRQRQRPAPSCVLAGPHDTAEQPKDSHRLCKRVRRFSPRVLLAGLRRRAACSGVSRRSPAWYVLVALLFSSSGPQRAYLSYKAWIDRAAGAVMFGLGLKLVTSAAKP